MFRKIILATTPHEVCQCASDYALALAREEKAELIIFYALGPMEHGWGAVRHYVPSGLTDDVANDMRNYYADKTSGIENWRVVVEPGVCREQLLKLAWKHKPDIIVMGPNTKYDTENRKRYWGMAGSTLQHVAAKARCPVAVVSRAYDSTSIPVNNILCATDFSEASNNAVNYGCKLARHFNAHLHLLHVLDIGPGGLSEQQYFEQGNDLLQEALERMEREYTRHLVPKNFSYHAEEGVPYVEILKAARHYNADLIVMAHQNHGGEALSELDSLTMRVAVHHSPPVISVHRNVKPCDEES